MPWRNGCYGDRAAAWLHRPGNLRIAAVGRKTAQRICTNWVQLLISCHRRASWPTA